LLEKKILRGVLYDVVNEDFALDNLTSLQQSSLVVRDEGTRKALDFITKFYFDHGDIPQQQTIVAHFVKEKDKITAKLVEDAVKEVFYKPSDYRNLIKATKNHYREQDLAGSLKTAAEILRLGKRIDGKDLKGPDDMLDYIMDTIPQYTLSNSVHKTSGDVREDASDMRMEYIERKDNTANSVGILTGLEPVDIVTRGIQPGELFVPAAFIGGYKSTFSLKMTHSVVTSGFNAAFISLEMPYDQVRRILYTIHSGSEKFTNIHEPLEYEKIKFGTLEDEEEDFYLNHVLNDFDSNPVYGKLFVHQMDSSEVTLDRIRTIAEMFNKEAELDALFIDYMTLIKPARGQRFSSRSEAINQNVQDLKNLALHFDGGRSIPVISPCQINRQGWRKAGENEGVYDVTAIAEFNQIEKAADLIVGIYVDDNMKNAKEAKCSVLKARDARTPPPFLIYADGATRQIGSFDSGEEITEEGIVDIDF